MRWLRAGIVVVILHGCGTEEPPEPPVFDIVDRAVGDRTPLSRPCEDLDEARCLLPYPSNALTVVDPDSETGIRLAVDARALNGRDDPSRLALADGFSPVSPLLAAVPRPVDEGTLDAAVHLYAADGTEVPVRVETLVEENGETLILADPQAVLAPNADYVVVIDDALMDTDGVPFEPPRGVQVAMGLEPPLTREEADLVGYHAPIRAFVAERGLAPERVLFAWDFTTRSEDSPRAALRHAREQVVAAVEGGDVGVVFDNLVVPDDRPDVALIAFGHLTNVPTFLAGDGGEDGLEMDTNGLPMEVGRTDAPFRVLIPAGTEDYRFLMFGHGTGGNEADASFDDDLAAEGLAKVGVRIYGWTDADVIETFTSLQQTVRGSYAAASKIVEALAHAAGIERAMVGVLGDALAADTIDGMPNPLAGRRPDGSIPMWVGGSLGGTTGVIYAASDPRVRYAVVNVPGAGWSHWVWHSETFDLVYGVAAIRYRDDIDLATALSIGQTNLDLADGAVWASALQENPTAFLVQESIGDPILPNQGTEMVAVAVGARHVGGVLEPIEGLDPADEVIEGSGITQFLAPEGGRFDVHGFAARDNPAGEAARQQIVEFVRSALAGESRIAPPEACPTGCDYR